MPSQISLLKEVIQVKLDEKKNVKNDDNLHCKAKNIVLRYCDIAIKALLIRGDVPAKRGHQVSIKFLDIYTKSKMSIT